LCTEKSDSAKMKQLQRLVSSSSTAGSDIGPVKSQASPDTWQAFRVSPKCVCRLYLPSLSSSI